MRAGEPADGAAARALAERHREHISRWFYPCSPQMHRGLGEMYIADERFTRTYEREAEGLAAYLHDAIVANADAHDGGGQSVIRMWPGSSGDALEPGSDRRVGIELEPGLRRHVGVGVQRDVGDRVALADEERRARPGGSPSPSARRCRRVAWPRRRLRDGVIPAITQNRATAMFGSWLYCSKNSHWSTCARSNRSSGRYGVPSAK